MLLDPVGQVDHPEHGQWEVRTHHERHRQREGEQPEHCERLGEDGVVALVTGLGESALETGGGLRPAERTPQSHTGEDEPEGAQDYRTRVEEAHLPDDVFSAGRADVLGALAGKRHLFHTAYAREHWEAPARANVERELAVLRG